MNHTAEEKEILAERFLTGNLYKLRHLTAQLQPEELAEILNASAEIDVHKVFQVLAPEKAIHTFENLDFNAQEALLETFDSQQLTDTLNKISPDDRTQLFEKLPDSTVQKYLSLLTDEERKTAKSLLQYPEESIGRLMTPDFISIKEDWTVQQVLDYVRRNGKDSETLNVIYVTDSKGVLIDDFRMREFLLAPLDKKVHELMDHQFVSLNAKDDQETAVKAFKQTNRVALPVTDFNGLLLGIITIDDVVDVMEEEDTEDIQKIGGVEALDEPYLEIDLKKMIRKRASWLIILFIGEMFTATAMGHFEVDISKLPLLAIFIPLIISSGGNSGSQASTLIIRALALGEVTLSVWWKVIRREFISGLMLGIILGAIGFFRIFLWQKLGFKDYGDSERFITWISVGYTVALSLVGIVLWGTLAGSLLPLFIKRLGGDPAVSSAPFIATLVDVTGIIIYFSVAFIVLPKGIFH